MTFGRAPLVRVHKGVKFGGKLRLSAAEGSSDLESVQGQKLALKLADALALKVGDSSMSLSKTWRLKEGAVLKHIFVENCPGGAREMVDLLSLDELRKNGVLAPTSPPSLLCKVSPGSVSPVSTATCSQHSDPDEVLSSISIYEKSSPREEAAAGGLSGFQVDSKRLVKLIDEELAEGQLTFVFSTCSTCEGVDYPSVPLPDTAYCFSDARLINKMILGA
jgi:hypothetical protein